MGKNKRAGKVIGVLVIVVLLIIVGVGLFQMTGFGEVVYDSRFANAECSLKEVDSEIRSINIREGQDKWLTCGTDTQYFNKDCGYKLWRLDDNSQRKTIGEEGPSGILANFAVVICDSTFNTANEPIDYRGVTDPACRKISDFDDDMNNGREFHDVDIVNSAGYAEITPSSETKVWINHRNVPFMSINDLVLEEEGDVYVMNIRSPSGYAYTMEHGCIVSRVERPTGSLLAFLDPEEEQPLFTQGQGTSQEIPIGHVTSWRVDLQPINTAFNPDFIMFKGKYIKVVAPGRYYEVKEATLSNGQNVKYTAAEKPMFDNDIECVPSTPGCGPDAKLTGEGILPQEGSSCDPMTFSAPTTFTPISPTETCIASCSSRTVSYDCENIRLDDCIAAGLGYNPTTNECTSSPPEVPGDLPLPGECDPIVIGNVVSIPDYLCLLEQHKIWVTIAISFIMFLALFLIFIRIGMPKSIAIVVPLIIAIFVGTLVYTFYLAIAMVVGVATIVLITLALIFLATEGKKRVKTYRRRFR